MYNFFVNRINYRNNNRDFAILTMEKKRFMAKVIFKRLSEALIALMNDKNKLTHFDRS